MHKCKIFNFLVIWIEVDIFIRKLIKRIEISVNVRILQSELKSVWIFEKFTKWIEICLNIRKIS